MQEGFIFRSVEEFLEMVNKSEEIDVPYKSLKDYYEATKTDNKTYEEFLNESVSQVFEQFDDEIYIFDISVKSPSGKIQSFKSLPYMNQRKFEAVGYYMPEEYGEFEIEIRLHGTNIGTKITEVYSNEDI